MKKGLISVIVPVYNEKNNIFAMHDRVKKTFDMTEYDFELIFVDNCSKDNTVDEIRKLSQVDKRVRGILMSRNFGTSQPSTMAGVHHAKGDAVVLIDGDIQDPPEMIIDFIDKWEEGFEVIYGIRKKRKGPLYMRFFYKMFYRVFKAMSYIDMPLDAGDFGLIDRKVVDEIKKLKENEIFFRGLRAWVGFKQIGIEYVRHGRHSGKTNVSFFNNFKWAKMGIYNFSYKPLEYISKMAMLFTFLSILGIIYYIILHFVYKATPYGFSTTVILILFMSSVQLFSLGIMGEYIARIFNEVKGRPRYIIREIINSNNNQEEYLNEAKEIKTGGDQYE
ncbi:MAG: glycosyltransferase family 2 protein [Clostridia bacterium]|nr:glycosyltransferase family 2 protein [Clostridia bacterium]